MAPLWKTHRYFWLGTNQNGNKTLSFPQLLAISADFPKSGKVEDYVGEGERDGLKDSSGF